MLLGSGFGGGEKRPDEHAKDDSWLSTCKEVRYNKTCYLRSSSQLPSVAALF
jgi:hypothetical protein